MTALPAVLEKAAPRLLPLQSRGADEALAHLTPSAVLVMFYPRGNDIRFVLTKRPETLANHPGQISLPGGRAEEYDRDLWDTATRETREELGIETQSLLPLGRLDAIRMNVTRYLITPFVAWEPHTPAFVPDAGEVERVIEVSLPDLLDPDSVYTDQWTFREREWRVVAYRFGGDVVWGATARILGDLARRLDPSLPSEPSPGSVEALDGDSRTGAG